MIKKFWCFLWGHKTVVKAYTGETMLTKGRCVGLYRWKRMKFCARCGKDCHDSEYETK